MEDILAEIVARWGYVGITLLICVENVFPPIPSEAVLLAAGFGVSTGALRPVPVIISATLGAYIGALVLYGLGRLFKKERLKRLFSGRVGKALHLKSEFVDEGDKWFEKYEYKAVFFCRCVPVLRSIISIPAGIGEMKLLPFSYLTIAGSVLWNTLLTVLGMALGSAWESCLPYLKHYEHIVTAVLLVRAAAMGIWWLKNIRQK